PSQGSRILLHQSERAAKKVERLSVFSLLYQGICHTLITSYSFGNQGRGASLGEGFFIDSDCSSQVTFMSQRRGLDVRYIRFSEELVGPYPFNRILHERGGAIEQLLLVFDKELCRSRPLLGFQTVVDGLLPITQRLVLSCNLGMQLALGFSAFDLKELFPQKVSKKGVELVSIPFQSPHQRKLALFEISHESRRPFCLKKPVGSLRIDGGQQ